MSVSSKAALLQALAFSVIFLVILSLSLAKILMTSISYYTIA